MFIIKSCFYCYYEIFLLKKNSGIMGNCLNFIRIRNHNKVIELPILILGLSGAGKSEIGYILSGTKREDYTSTNGCKMFNYQNNEFSAKLTELGGSIDMRNIWSHYYNEAFGTIYIVDASDFDQLEYSQKVFTNLIRNIHISGKPILILANKQDEDSILDSISLCYLFNLEQLANETCTPCLLESCGRGQYDGLQKGVQWLGQTIMNNIKLIQNRVEFYRTFVPNIDISDKEKSRPKTCRVKKPTQLTDRPNSAPSRIALDSNYLFQNSPIKMKPMFSNRISPMEIKTRSPIHLSKEYEVEMLVINEIQENTRSG